MFKDTLFILLRYELIAHDLRNEMKSVTAFVMPPVVYKENGDPRRVGFELEYSGVGIEDSANVLQGLFGGNIKRKNAFILSLTETRLGDFNVEIDTALLADEKFQDYLVDLGIDIHRHARLKDSLEELLKRVAKTVVPCEIVMPPIPLPDLSPVELVVNAMREKRAEGTRASLLNAFGLHINVDLAETHAAYLLNHIRAFLLLFDWLCAEIGVDFTRRASAYIKQYPSEYEQLILDQGYQPSLDQLIDDYLDLVGSRNYALDMLPAFAHIDSDRVMARAEEPSLIKARPAFHYRLSNSRVNETDWNVANEWRFWVKVEQVAANSHLLEAVTASRRAYMQRLPIVRGAWEPCVRELLENEFQH